MAEARRESGVSNDKDRQLDPMRTDSDRQLTTNTGVRVDDTDNSLSVGDRGPTLMEDFHFREKITHFDHERIPERVVHARGAGAYGYFHPYESMSRYTRAAFLSDPAEHTPVFVRFSTVAGSRGSADTVRDVRGFATKFYTREGNFDLVGNNMPVFFIQDGIKFPDFVHAVKPEPHNEIPQAQSAHDTLWDFVGLQPETTHMMMWLMSDRAIPRSFRMMQGFGVHTFRLVNEHGQGTFVKFHWKPLLGTHSLVWDECQKIAGKDPDYNRRDLWEAIERGQYPEWELGFQLVPESDEHSFDFDLLDPTKIIPEELVPVTPVGRLVLNRNPDNFFAETEQIAFHTANVVPGIDFTNDPLLQARNFSYLDTQLIRLGGPNFQQIPVNRPVAEVHNNQRDGFGQQRVHRGQTSYFPNSLGGGCPYLASVEEGAYQHYQERVDGAKIRRRSPSFADHYSQATLFYNSMSPWEKQHLTAAFRFELGKCEHMHVRERVVHNLNHVDHTLAREVATGIGVQPPVEEAVPNHGRSSPALSQANTAMDSIFSRQIAVLVADGVVAGPVLELRQALEKEGALVELLAPTDGSVRGVDGDTVEVDRALTTMASVLYDAVVVPGGVNSVETLLGDGYAVHFVTEAFKHAKPVAGIGEGVDLLARLPLPGVRLADGTNGVVSDRGVVSTRGGASDAFNREFTDLLAHHRVWDRETDAVPA
ncbi:catalase [Marinitenerispora sediminis]|uniref:Catalase n=1 Tax=Marinitenerispora sediminis TaxID=1931232 RepID=A0A368T8N5_9ACTN|nr:catalase [Marinitenerispora sediminis]RCV53527.1 catalase HPII [Marinitenerispora sediminis]RCV57683.1 catalase HPII [Marinitenerispora sediminis]RCV60760.1 catalase HPII [Marinitenerispora sediminis]